MLYKIGIIKTKYLGYSRTISYTIVFREDRTKENKQEETHK